MKKIFICFAIWLVCVAEGTAADKIIKIVDSPWLPYYGQFLPNYGLVPEIVTAAYAQTGYTPKYNVMSWSRALKDLKNGKYDAVVTASYTEERAKIYLYSEFYMASPIVFFKRRESPITWNTLDDLKNYKIAVLKGYSYSPDFDASSLRKVVARSEVLSFKKLYYKQADLVVMDQVVGHYILTNKLVGAERDAVPLQPPLYTDKLYLMFSKKIPNVKEKIKAFNKGLKVIKSNGTFSRILAKHGIFQ
ncbi:MAG: transporter substrate-binding domain-containing protein [Proteobacteria bacterium]|nr:transporter substrate-binding domain-containing protein [Pseudomonadota bacterium]